MDKRETSRDEDRRVHGTQGCTFVGRSNVLRKPRRLSPGLPWADARPSGWSRSRGPELPGTFWAACCVDLLLLCSFSLRLPRVATGERF